MSNMNTGAPGMSYPDIPRNSDLDDVTVDETSVTTTDDELASGDVADELDVRAAVDEDMLPDEDEYPRLDGS